MEVLRRWIGNATFLAAALALLLAVWATYLHFIDRLRHIPGPRSARFTKLWMFRAYLQGDFEKTNLHLHQKLGPIVRIAPNQYSLDDPKAAKIIYGHGTKFTKADWYAPWSHPEFRNLFSDQNPSTHAALRRQLSKAYSMSAMLAYEKYVDECTSIFHQRLSEFASAGTLIDLGYWLQCYAFDMIGKITFAKRFGFLNSGEDIMEMMKQIDEVSRYSALVGVFASLHPYIFKFVQAFNLGGDGIAFIDRYGQSMIRAHNESDDGDHPASFVTMFMDFRKDNPGELTDEAVRAATSTNMFAGSDTTSISLSAILFHLYQQPTALARLRKELEDGHQAGTVSDPITFQEAQNLPYLQAVIKEGLRLHPATGFTMPRVVPAGGITLLDQYFPEGSIVGINAWVAHMNKSVYGEDAEIFRPERWLDDPSTNSSRESYYFTFGQGSRTCVGKNIALLEITKAVPQFVRKFGIEIAGKSHWETQNNWFVKPQNFRAVITMNEKLP